MPLIDLVRTAPRAVLCCVERPGFSWISGTGVVLRWRAAAPSAGLARLTTGPAMSFRLFPVALLAALHAYIGSRLLGVLPAPWGVVGAGLLIGLFLLVLSAASPILGRRAATGVLAW